MYQFGPFLLDTISFRLTKDGDEIEIEPQVFKTLLLLLKHRERVVVKAELLEKIWQGRVVSDSVITRIIYELRKILDVELDQGSHIRTVRGKGYQFVAVVKQSTGSDGGKTYLSWNQSQKVSNRLKLGFIVFTGLLLLGSYWLMQNRNNDPIQQQTITANTGKQPNKNPYSVVAVLPIEVGAGSDKLLMLVQSLVDYLVHQLALNLNMKVIHPDSLVNMGGQSADIGAIQQTTRSDFIIKGFIEPVADQNIRLHLILYKHNADDDLTPFPLGAFEFTYPQSQKELNDLYKQRKITVRSIIEIIKPGINVKDSGDFETQDPQAYRLVIAAHHMARSDDCKDMQRTEELLLKAVERDDEFVYAYLQLFTNYYKRVWICGASTDFHQKGLAMAEIIDRLAPNSYQAVAMRRSTILVESNQAEKAFELAKNFDWNNPEAVYQQSYILRYAGFLNKTSENVDRILQIDPFFFNDKPIEQAPNTLLYLNQYDAHLALLAEPGNSYHDFYRALNLFFTHQLDQATTVLQRVVDRTPEDLFGQFSMALLHVIAGESEKAIAVIDAIVEQRANKKHSDGEMTYKVAQLYAMAGAKKLALKHLQITVDQGFFPMNYFLIDPALESIQGSQIFSSIVLQATLRHEAFAQRFGLKAETADGLKLD